jgi:hypothetical protein
LPDLPGVHPETPGQIPRPARFLFGKAAFFRYGKEIKGLCGGVQGYAAQESPKIDTARAEKDPFRMETRLEPFRPYHGNCEINKKENRNSRCKVDHPLNSFALYFVATFYEQKADYHHRDSQEKHPRQPYC